MSYRFLSMYCLLQWKCSTDLREQVSKRQGMFRVCVPFGPFCLLQLRDWSNELAARMHQYAFTFWNTFETAHDTLPLSLKMFKSRKARKEDMSMLP